MSSEAPPPTLKRELENNSARSRENSGIATRLIDAGSNSSNDRIGRGGSGRIVIERDSFVGGA